MSLETFGAELAVLTKAHIAKALTSVIERLEAIETRIGTVKDGAAGPPGPAGERGADGPQGAEGPAGIPGRDGLPGVQGPAGANGKDGTNGADGVHGKDGADGLRVEDLSADWNADTRVVTFRFVRDGAVLTEIALKLSGVQVFRGVFAGGRVYEPGDTVTFNGCQWCAQADTSVRPDEHTVEGRRDWLLCVKRGGDGKKGEPGAAGRDGKDGRAGRDLTQMDTAGRKW